jgi:NAD(P)-dependent dehydrogenase (short-subunit alcohol dehydrogenase family)
MDDLNGRVAVITGGASGIGLATARALAREGMHIVVADIEQAAIDRVLPEIAALGVETLGVRTDVSKLADVQALADRTWERFGACHVLFNNAGVAISGPMAEMRHEDWEWLMRVNLWGPIHGVEVFVPRLIAQGQGGHVVSTASFAGLVANDGLGIYCVTKYGVVALMECLYRELSPHGIGASVLCPMRVETNIGSSARNRPDDLGGPMLPAADAEAEDRPQAGRIISPEEVAPMVVTAIRQRRLYIVTHPESRPFVQSRFRRIDRAYDEWERDAQGP